MRIALVDDDKAQTDLLRQLISEELSAHGNRACKITAFANGEEFLAAWDAGDYDLIVLDIYMGEVTGIEVAYRIRQKDDHVLLAFCTSSNEYAGESYEVGARYYLRKPITKDNVAKMFRRFNLEAIEKTRTVKLPDNKSVMLHRILYTEYENHIVTVYINGEPPHRLRTSQGVIEALLIENGHFMSPYKGIIVNFHAIESLTDDSITLVDKTVLPITRRRQKEFKEAYNKFRFDRMRKEVVS